MSTDTLESLLQGLRHDRVPPEARTVYRGRNHLWAVVLSDGTEVNIKAFHRPRGLNAVVYGWLRPTKARRSWQNARRLTQMRFGTPEPLGYVENRDALGRLTTSYYVSRQLAAGVTDVRWWELRPDRDALVDALGAEVARMFRAGVRFRDFSPGNVLQERDPATGAYRFYYVDLNRMAFGERRLSRLMHMFRAINIAPAETSRLALATARAGGWDPQLMERRALRVLLDFLRLKDRRRALKRLLRLGKPS